MNPEDKPVAFPEVVLREEFDDWVILFQPLTGETMGTGPVGVAIWKLLDGRRTLAEIATAVAALCADAPAADAVLADTLAFAGDLHRRLFIRLPDE